MQNPYELDYNRNTKITEKRKFNNITDLSKNSLEQKFKSQLILDTSINLPVTSFVISHKRKESINENHIIKKLKIIDISDVADIKHQS